MKTANVTTQKIRGNHVSWYQTEGGKYTVAFISEAHDSPLAPGRNWVFGSSALSEAFSFYWYQQVSKMVENIDEYPNEIIPKLNKGAEQIEAMCYAAMKHCFPH